MVEVIKTKPYHTRMNYKTDKGWPQKHHDRKQPAKGSSVSFHTLYITLLEIPQPF